MSAENDWEKLWREYEKEERESLEGHDPVLNKYVLKTFVSKSAGRGRRRRSREVELVVDLDTGEATQLKDVPTGRLDTIAQALLGGLPNIDNPFQEFVRRLRRK